MPILNRFPFCTEKIVDGTNIFGASWDGSSSTAWTRTDTSAAFPNPTPYTLNSTSYKSKFDKYLPWRGMVKEEIEGVGTCVKIPKFWYKLTNNNPGIKIQIADYAASGFSVSPTHMNRGDGKGERDYIYVGRYKCTTNAYKSVTNTGVKNMVSRDAARSGIHALGTNVWPWDFATLFTIWLLYLVEYANWNSQAKIGYGCMHSDNNNNMYGSYNTGRADGVPYHTGTTKSSLTSYGVCQYRWIEDIWGQSFEYLDGCYYNGSGLNIILNPSSFVSTQKNGTLAGSLVSGFPKAFTIYTPSGLFPIFLPTTAGGSNSTYTCDKWEYSSSNYQLFVGARNGTSQDYGLFNIVTAASGGSSNIYAHRLMVLP